MSRLASLALLSLFATACDAGEEPSLPTGATASVKLFNASMPFIGIDVDLADGTTIKDDIRQGQSSAYVEVPVQGELRITHTEDGFTLPADPINLTEDSRYSWFFAGAGGGAGWRFEVVEDDFPEAIPGVSFVRFVMGRQNITDPSEVYVDGAILVSNLGYNHDFVSSFAAVGAGNHPLRLDAAGGDTWDTNFEDFSTADGGYYTIIINSNANVGGQELFATINEH